MDERIEILETSELEGGPEGIGIGGYSQLLALYLADGQLCNAKFLWKRIPQAMKTNTELAALWNLAQKLWLKEITGFYTAANAFQWSTTIAPIVHQLVEGFREKTKRLIGTAYSSISSQDVGNLMGLSEAEIQPFLASQGWTMTGQNGIIKPTEPVAVHIQLSSSDDQLARLTDYVAFLEN